MVSIQQSRRRQKDVSKIIMKGYEVEILNEDNMSEFIVKFKGPKDSPYSQGQWKVRVTLPEQYPIKSPSIGFVNKIFHPNIDEQSGSVCLDVINQQWSPMYDLVNIFDVFLPQLLLYPNPTDPLNAEAASMQLKNQEQFNEKVKQYVTKYAAGETCQSQILIEKQTQRQLDPSIEQLSDTSDIELVQISDEEESKQ